MHIAILTWWISSEREIALRSGDNMRHWVEKSGHTCEVFDVPSDLHRFLERHMSARYARHFPTRQLTKNTEKRPDFDFVIPMLHGIYGEDGQITNFIKTLGYKYASSDPEVHALCIDKYLTNLFLEEIGIRIPHTTFLRRWSDFELSGIEFPVIVKPNHGWSSIATHRVDDHEPLAEALMDMPEDDDILIQECIEWREFTVGIYRDATGYHALPIIEILIKNDFFDYEKKYESDGTNEVFMEGESALQKRLSEESLRICEYIGTKWVTRIDWRYDGQHLYFLEVNTVPGFTSDSLVPKMWKQAGKSEEEFVGMLRG